MREICGIIAPRQMNIIGIREDGYLAECILKVGHGYVKDYGPHVFRTPEGRFFAWKDDWDCDCCEEDEDERCYIYWEITEDELPKYQIETAEK